MILACALTALSLAQTVPGLPVLSGTVLDPHGRVIVGAVVTLTCHGQAAATLRTDDDGSFIIYARADGRDCAIRVTHPGFVSFSHAIAAWQAPRVITLRVAPVVESVRVSAVDVPPLSRWAGLASASLSETDLTAIGKDVHRLMEYTKAAAGTRLGQDAIYIDGLPATVLPSAHAVRRITVNADPFSAEYGESDRNVIEITTNGPDRQVRFGLGGGALALGGRNPLDGRSPSSSRSVSLRLTGPIPWLPFTFSADASVGRLDQARPLRAVIPHGQPPPAVSASDDTSTMTGSMALAAYHSRPGLRTAVTFAESRIASRRSDAGGIVLPEAGSDSVHASGEIRASIEKAWEQRRYRGGIVFNHRENVSRAASRGLGVGIAGAFVGGGAPRAESVDIHRAWRAKHVVEAADQSWSAGINMSASRDTVTIHPNPAGFLQFESEKAYVDALTGAGRGTWLVDRGWRSSTRSDWEGAAFAQRDLLRGHLLAVRAGLRSDAQRRTGAALSPRVLAATRLYGFDIRGGGGAFVHHWPGDLLLVRTASPTHHRLIVRNVSIADTAAPPTNAAVLETTVDPSLTRRRDLVGRLTIERAFGRWSAGVEHTWTRGRNLLGSRRVPAEDGWLDRLESNRALDRRELRVRTQYSRNPHSFIAHYTWTDSHDDTDGAFSFAERHDDLARERAPTSGVPTHVFDVAARVTLPGEIALSLLGAWRSRTPYDVVVGRDLIGNGLFNDRGGRKRNSGKGPPHRSVTLFAHRRLRLPRSFPPAIRHLDLGLHVDNLLNTRNDVAYGWASTSALFGQPIISLPGRSIRIWASFD